MIDAYATQPHYIAHMAPIWQALGPEMGLFYIAGATLEHDENTEGIPRRVFGYPKPHGAGPVMVAGYADEQGTTRPTIYLEHGAGQTYRGDATARDNPSYSGSSGHRRTVLFLCPNQTVADRWTATYPRVPAVAVGVPKLDRLHRHFVARPWARPAETGQAPTVAITFHSESRACPETTSSWRHYAPHMGRVLTALDRAGVNVIGHGHPRIWERTLKPFWAGLGVEPVADLAEVMMRADVLCGDNTSALPEFASLGKPVVWMNAPWYRRDIEHGGRFWEWPREQVSVDGPAELADGILRAVEDPDDVRAARAAMVAGVYAACDGKATARAVAAILRVQPAASQRSYA